MIRSAGSSRVGRTVKVVAVLALVCAVAWWGWSATHQPEPGPLGARLRAARAHAAKVAAALDDALALADSQARRPKARIAGAAISADMVYASAKPWKHMSALRSNQVQSFVLHQDRVAGPVFLPPVHAQWVLGAEGHVLRAIDKLDCSAGALMVDVGSNDGIFSLLASKRGCATVAFELQHLCIEYLMAAHNINRAPATTVIQRPVAAVSGTPFSLPTAASCDGGFDVKNRKSIGGPTEELRSVALDDVFPDAHIAFLKIDIEGYEDAALVGARRLFERRAIDGAVVEACWWAYTYGVNALPAAMERVAFVYDFGYDIQCLATYPMEPRQPQLVGKRYPTKETWLKEGLRDWSLTLGTNHERQDVTACADILICPQSGCVYR